MASECPYITNIRNNASRQLALHAEISVHGPRHTALRVTGQAGRIAERIGAPRVINVAVLNHNVGIKGRIASRRVQRHILQVIVEQSGSSAYRHFAVAEDIESKSNPRSKV